jgi:transposase
MAKRKTISAELKAKIAIEALRESMTARELASKYEVSPVQISQWKKEFMERASMVFDRPDKGKDADAAKERDGLYKKVGELQMQVDFLKKNLAKL